MISLKDQCVMVTGSGRGIGAEIVKYLSRMSARVAVTYSSSKEQAEKVFQAVGRFGAFAFTNGCHEPGIHYKSF